MLKQPGVLLDCNRLPTHEITYNQTLLFCKSAVIIAVLHKNVYNKIVKIFV